jgi:hypothetical protein
MNGPALTVHCDASIKHAHAYIGFVAFDTNSGKEVFSQLAIAVSHDTPQAELEAIKMAQRHFTGTLRVTFCTDCKMTAQRAGVQKIKRSNNRAHGLVYAATDRAIARNAQRGGR